MNGIISFHGHNPHGSPLTMSHRAIQQLGRTLLAAYAYDNFDVNLKSTNHTIEHSTETLKHLTSGLLFPLMHGVVQDDLRCSQTLWERSLLNPQANQSNRGPQRGWEDLLSLHHDRPDEAGLMRRDQFNSWKMLSDIITFGPTYFSGFKEHLHDLETVEQIPVVKTPIVTA